MSLKLDKKCLNEVVIFENEKNKKNSFNNNERLIGKIVSSNKTNKTNKTKKKKNIYIYKALGNNKFSKKKQKYQKILKEKHIQKKI